MAGDNLYIVMHGLATNWIDINNNKNGGMNPLNVTIAAIPRVAAHYVLIQGGVSPRSRGRRKE